MINPAWKGLKKENIISKLWKLEKSQVDNWEEIYEEKSVICFRQGDKPKHELNGAIFGDFRVELTVEI